MSGGPVVRWDRIRWLVLDVDGVLTDGGVGFVEPEGEWRRFCAQDGSALVRFQQAGGQVALVSGRRSESLVRRAGELGIRHVWQGVSDKAAVVEELLARVEAPAGSVCYVADDWPDLVVRRLVGVFVAVADASPAVRAAADHVTRQRGGRGAVAEIVGLVLRHREQVRGGEAGHR